MSKNSWDRFRILLEGRHAFFSYSSDYCIYESFSEEQPVVFLTVHHFWEKQLPALGCSESALETSCSELWERGYSCNPAVIFFTVYSYISFALTEHSVPSRILLENDI